MPSTRWWTAEPERFDAFRSASADRSFAVGIGLPGSILECAQPRWVADVAAELNFPRFADAVAAGLRSAFAFPVLVGGRVAAVLEFFSTDLLAPEPVLLDAFGMVGVQLGRVFERQEAHESARRSEEQTRQILDTAGDAFIAMSSDGEITEWNQRAVATFGWSRAEALGRDVGDLIIPLDHREAHSKGIARFLSTGVPSVLGQRLELPALHRDGRALTVELTLWALPSSDGTWQFYTFARDITEKKAAAERLQFQAMHDDLTGLANRALLIDRLTQALAGCGSARPGPAVLFVDLDGFKLVNDSFGHAVGDRLLCEVAQRLGTVLRPGDTLARPAGDEFVLVLEEIDDERDASAVAKRIGDMFSQPIDLDGERVYVTASVGVALAEWGASAESVLADADAAMYRAKHEGRGRFEVFGAGMRSRAPSRLQVEAELRAAIAQPGELALHYQTVVDLTTAETVGVEALIRWHHPRRGLLLPGEFIGIAEETGLILPMGAWVLHEACRQARSWSERGFAHLDTAVNLSARQLAQADFIEGVAAAIDDVGIDPANLELCFEITESVLMADPDASAAVLTELRNIGFRLAIDDFGTGYSSLAYLRAFPVDIVKLDRSFITNIDVNGTDRTIVGAVIDLAHALDLTVVAEGVETEGQRWALQELGCDVAQGYLFSRPAPASEVEALLRSVT